MFRMRNKIKDTCMSFRFNRFSIKTLLLIVIASVCIATGGMYSFADDSGETAAVQTQNDEPGKEVSKKGIQIVDGNYPLLVDIQDIGVSYGFLNFFYNELVSSEPTGYSYTYKGQTYYYNADKVALYDNTISSLTNAGISIVAAVVNGYNKDFPQLRYPGVDFNDGTQYYAFNAVTEEGINLIESCTYFLAERYNGGDRGKVVDWVIGNEVNDNLQYNYLKPREGSSYVAEYYKQFKMFYNVIKEINPDAEVYIPLEHRWQTANTMTDYGARWFLEEFNRNEKKDQQMDWGVAWHPYPYPLGDPDTLDDGDEPTTDTDGSPTYGGEVTMDEYTPLVSMKNIDILTDYFTKNLLTQSGQVRSIIVSEVGYTSYSVICGQNEAKQAANIAYSYYKAESNPYIKAFIIRAHRDISEGSPYFQFGLRYKTEIPKLSYEMFKYMDTTDSLEYTQFALDVLGIDSWNEVIDNFEADMFAQMKSIDHGGVFRNADSLVPQEAVQLRGGTDIWDMNQDDAIYSSRVRYFDSLDLSNVPYLCVGINLDKAAVLRIRVTSKDHIYDAYGSLTAGDGQYIYTDLSGWKYRNSIDRVEIWLSDTWNTAGYTGNDSTAALYATDSVTTAGEITCNAPQKKDITAASVSPVGDVLYSGEYYTPSVEVRYNGELLTQNDDYSLSYTHNKKGPVANVIVTGIGEYSGQIKTSFNIISRYSELVDPVYYFKKYPAAASACGNDYTKAEEYFINYGMAAGHQACEKFNVYYYQQNYEDLRNAFGDNLIAYYNHYITYGLNEGRIASHMLSNTTYNGVDYAAVYNKVYYITRYPDIAKRYDNDDYLVLKYFVEEGTRNKQRGNDIFDIEAYAKYNPDLMATFRDDIYTYYLHYILYGQYENRICNGTFYDERDYSKVYNEEYYYNNNPDVAETFGRDSNMLLKHFIVNGMAEGRKGSLDFDLETYKQYSDLKNAFGDDNKAYYIHYIDYGAAEHRIATSSTVYNGVDYKDVYNKDYYLAKYGDLRNAFGDDERALIEHFVKYGMKEGRQACEEFNPYLYRTLYSDLREAFGYDMERYYIHYMNVGKAEGR